MQLDFNYNGLFHSAFNLEDARAAGVPEAVLAAAAAEQAKQSIDGAASRARSRHSTMISGQGSMYMIKADEAARYIAAGSPADASAYALLSAEAQALQITTTARHRLEHLQCGNYAITRCAMVQANYMT